MTVLPGLRQIADDLQSGKVTAQRLASAALEKVNLSEYVFISVNQKLEQQAKEIDQARADGKKLPALAGLPITLKDLFDVFGELTLAGSKALKNFASPANQDCPVVSSLRRAGLLFAGRTNMSEFAFSGMGLNPHYGNPRSIWDRDTGRLAGGSSSGSAVSVAEGIVSATMGSDTAGSCRIPAAFNGIVGVKPSFGRFSLEGIYPLSPTSDAPGPLAVDLDSCFVLDQILTGEWDGYADIPNMSPYNINQLALLIPDSIVMSELDDEVNVAFSEAVNTLKQAGATIMNEAMPVLDDCVDLFMTAPIAGYEAYQHHRDILQKYGDDYDPVVYQRIVVNQKVTEQDQATRYSKKSQLTNNFNDFMTSRRVDAVIYPTTPCIPPAIDYTLLEGNMLKTNLRCLRNTSTANYFNGCSISLPINRSNDAPVGFMVSLGHNQDEKLYRIAAAIEATLVV